MHREMGSVSVNLDGDIPRKNSGNTRRVNANEEPQGEDELIAVAKVVKSNSLWNEGRFSHTDNMYLQRKAKIWLGEVLRVIFEDEALVADLLADGELLFNLSMVLREKVMKLPAGSMNPNVMIYERTPSGRNTASYMAYPKIDSFLKICKVIGLRSIDLFSPSDVVEKRNTRGVCLCLRTLSKKARSKDLDLPDFDTVTCAIPTPKDMVRFVPRNLQQPQICRQNSDPIGLKRHSAVEDGDGYLQDIESAQNNFPFQDQDQDPDMDGSYSSGSDGSGSLSPSRTGSAEGGWLLGRLNRNLKKCPSSPSLQTQNLVWSSDSPGSGDDPRRRSSFAEFGHREIKVDYLRGWLENNLEENLSSISPRPSPSIIGNLDPIHSPTAKTVDDFDDILLLFNDVVRSEPVVEVEVPVVEEEEKETADPPRYKMFLETIGNGVLLAAGLFFALQFSGETGGGNGWLQCCNQTPARNGRNRRGICSEKTRGWKEGGWDICSVREWFRF